MEGGEPTRIELAEEALQRRLRGPFGDVHDAPPAKIADEREGDSSPETGGSGRVASVRAAHLPTGMNLRLNTHVVALERDPSKR